MLNLIVVFRRWTRRQVMHAWSTVNGKSISDILHATLTPNILLVNVVFGGNLRIRYYISVNEAVAQVQ